MAKTAREIVQKAAAEKRRYLMEHESKAVLEEERIATTGGILARSEQEACDAFDAVGGHAAMKVVSPQVVHKSDAGGVKLDIRDRQQAADAYRP